MTRAYNNSLLARNINISGINTVVTGLLVSDSGNFVNGLRVNNIDVSLDGHQHWASDIIDLGSAVSGYAPPTTNASLLTTGILADSLLSGNVVLTNDSRLTDARIPLSHNHAISEVSGLQTALDSKQAAGSYALSSHNHTSSNITDFNSSVSGLTSGIYATISGAIFTGSISSPSGNFTEKLRINGIDVSLIQQYSTVASFPATGSSTSYYIASDSSRLYQWTGSYYAEIGPPVTSINNAQNAANLYLWSNFK